jgi:RNA polymerase subunit RPABC4/transcription elongation factor Spt4
MKKKECPSCAMEIMKDEKICPICGYEFPNSNGMFKYLAVILIVIFMLFMFKLL